MKKLLTLSLLLGTSYSLSAAELEQLHGVQFTENYMTIFVTSTGCTEKEDFVTALEKSTTPAGLMILRTKPDICRGASRVYPIKYSYNEIGGKNVKVLNHFVPAPNL